MIRLSITTTLRESRGTYHYQEETLCSLARTKAHGFAVLSETAVFQYKCDNFYHPEADGQETITAFAPPCFTEISNGFR